MSSLDAISSLAGDVDLLVVFAIVVRERSFTSAAAVLGISQPSISARIRRLEEQVGEPVFERLARGVRLTPVGEALRAAADRALGVAQDANELLLGLAGLSRGHVRFAASTTIARYVLPPCIGTFHGRYPEVEMDLRVGNTAEVAAWIERGDVGWGLVEGPVDTTRFEARRVMDDELILIVPMNHPWARRRRVAPRELAGQSFVGREAGSGTGAVYESTLAERGVRLRPLLRLGDSRAIAATVASGGGIAIVSAIIAQPFLAAKQVARVDVAGLDLRRPFTLVQRPGRSMPRLDAIFLSESRLCG